MNEAAKSDVRRLSRFDFQYFKNIKCWFQSIFRFKFQNAQLRSDDLVFLKKDLPHIFFKSEQTQKGAFISLKDLVDLCEVAAVTNVSYELFLDSTLENVYLAMSVLNDIDSQRLVKYFKHNYDIEDLDEGLLHAAAVESLEKIYV